MRFRLVVRTRGWVGLWHRQGTKCGLNSDVALGRTGTNCPDCFPEMTNG